MRFIKPLDEEIILAMAKSHDVLITIEENVLAGGAG
jgi:1-deoxy-D-xylulose-5-phosphate synthase